MNKNAEAFKKYLDEKEIKVFEVEETPDDAQETAVFRSHMYLHGHSRIDCAASPQGREQSRAP